MPRLTHHEATELAREFVTDYVRRNRPWETETLATYLPYGAALRKGADYAGPSTITDIALFLRAETIVVA